MNSTSCRVGEAAMWGVVAVMVAFAFLAYQIPDGYRGAAGAFSFGTVLWLKAAHIPRVLSCSIAAFRLCLCIAIVSAWLSYAAVLAFAFREQRALTRRRVIFAAIGLAIVSVVFPPVFSADTAAYATYGRMQAIYGLNPYITTSDQLMRMGDPFLRSFGSTMYWHIPTVYGPIWQLLSAPIAYATHSAPAWVPILIFKLLSAASLLVMALAAGSIAEGLAPGARLAGFYAVVLNPLFLLEGPGSGHNDLLTVALVLLAFACLLRGFNARAGLCLGLAIGIKLFPVALVFWFAARIWRCSDRKARDLSLLFAGSFLPLIVGYVPYWHGVGTFGQLRSTYGKTQHSPVLTGLIYLAMTAWLAYRPDLRTMVRLWSLLTVWLAMYSMPIPYPWYLTWSLAPILCLQDPGSRRWIAVFTTLAAAGMLHSYAFPPPP